MQLQPYLFFEGRCEEAARFYEGAVGAKVQRLIRFKDSPDPTLCRADEADKVMTGETDADRRFNALADGGQVLQPLMKTFFSPRFGMVTDRFGVSWMIHAAP